MKASKKAQLETSIGLSNHMYPILMILIAKKFILLFRCMFKQEAKQPMKSKKKAEQRDVIT